MSRPKQCKSLEIFKELQCQGVPGHCNCHWAYDPGGHLIQWVNKKEKDPRWKHVACSWTPPEHQGWISPINMVKYHYLTIWAEQEMAKRDKKGNVKSGKTRNRRSK